MTELVGIPFSPWSEKARWALEVRRVPYRKVTYAPLIGELGLRRRMGKWSGRVSVPVLFDDDGRPIADSLAIAQWADTRGEGESLFPEDLRSEVLRFAELSERALAAGRALSLPRMLDDRDALLEMVPKRSRRTSGCCQAPSPSRRSGCGGRCGSTNRRRAISARPSTRPR
jgi:glutathione S-transferase